MGRRGVAATLVSALLGLGGAAAPAWSASEPVRVGGQANACSCASVRAADVDFGRRAVPGPAPTSVRRLLDNARHALAEAERATVAGRDRRALTHLQRAEARVASASVAAFARADAQLPGGVDAVRAVTAEQHAVLRRGAAMAVRAEGRLYRRVAEWLGVVAEDRDEAARYLLDTEGAGPAIAPIATEIAVELQTLHQFINGVAADGRRVRDLQSVSDALADTADALAPDTGVDEDVHEDVHEDVYEDDAGDGFELESP